jgi:predicted nucleic acid-binding protein
MSIGASAVMNSSSLEVVCDAGPLIHLDELGCLDLLADFQTVYVPEQVQREVEHHRPRALQHPDVGIELVAVALLDDVSFQTLVLALALGLGEQATLTLMVHHPDAILLTDDAAARLAATGLGYRTHGSVGVLLRAIRRQQRTSRQVLSLLRNLPSQSSLHIRSTLLEEIIARVQSGRAG